MSTGGEIMLINVNDYLANIKDTSLEGLIKERNKVVKQLDYYEKNKGNPDRFDLYPTPEAIYKWNNLILIAITNMIMNIS